MIAQEYMDVGCKGLMIEHRAFSRLKKRKARRQHQLVKDWHDKIQFSLTFEVKPLPSRGGSEP